MAQFDRVLLQALRAHTLFEPYQRLGQLALTKRQMLQAAEALTESPFVQLQLGGETEQGAARRRQRPGLGGPAPRPVLALQCLIQQLPNAGAGLALPLGFLTSLPSRTGRQLHEHKSSSSVLLSLD
jgi:hypothetical protein